MSGIRIVDMPDLGAVTSDSSVVGEHAGSGRFSASAFSSYVLGNFDFNTYADGGTLTDSSGPYIWFKGNEAFTMGTGFYEPVVVDFRRTGGTGNRQAFTAQQYVNGATPGEMHVGSAGFCFLESGTGSVFGMNSYARVTAGSAPSASLVSLEANTDMQVPGILKTGIQIIDVSTSVADASAESAGLVIAKQAGGVGYRTGVQFGLDATAGSAAVSQALIRTASTGGTVARGLDLRSATFTAPAIDLPADGGIAGSIAFANGSGGSIQSSTTTNGPIVTFGSNALAVQTPGGVSILHVDTSAQIVTVPNTLKAGVACIPQTDNAASLGGPSNRWLAVWAVNGTIQTSDPALKTEVMALRDHDFKATDIVNAVQPVTYKWITGGHEIIDEQPVPVPGNRTHWGFMAPDLKAAFDRIGLDFGGYVKAEDGTQHLRPDQLIPVLWRACQEMAARIEALEAR